MTAKGPTLAQIRKWPAAVDVAVAATALGISRTTAYASIARGDFPAKWITAGRRKRVLTASLLEVLGDDGAARPP